MVATQIGAIISNVAEHANDMNRRWGFNRLPHIVSIETMKRFKTQRTAWELACFECCESMMPADLERMTKVGEAMKRAYAALDAEAQALGRMPAAPGTWEFELPDGTPIVLVRTRAEMGNVEREPKAQVWCLEEIGEIVTRFPQLIAVKDQFPNAEVVKMGPSNEAKELIDDCLSEIPFGD
jgi:hypothetical protein